MNWIVVIPLKDEADSIGAQVLSLLEYNIDVVVAVDGKTTDEAITEATRAGARVIIVPPGNKGLAKIYRYALAVCAEQNVDVVVEMDAGGSHRAEDISKFIKSFENNIDIAFGRRFGKGAIYSAPLSRKLLSWGGTLLTNLTDHPFNFKKWWKDGTSGYIAYSTPALKQLLRCEQQSTGYYYQTEVRRNARKLGLRTVEVPIIFRSSSSSLRIKDVWEAIKLAFS